MVKVRLVSRFSPGRSGHTRFDGDWSSDVCSSDLAAGRFRKIPAGAGRKVSTLPRLLRTGGKRYQNRRRRTPQSPAWLLATTYMNGNSSRPEAGVIAAKSPQVNSRALKNW